MKHIFLLVVVAVAVAQFSVPDISAIGQAIKNGVVEAEHKVENLAREEIQNAGNLIHEGVEKISQLVDPAPPAPAPQPAQAPQEKPIPSPQSTVITTEFAVFAPASQVVVVAEVPPAKTKPVEPQTPSVQPLEVAAKHEQAIISEPLEQTPKEHRKGHKHAHKPHRERKEEASSDSSDDIEEKRAQKHERKEGKERKKHDHNGQDMKQRREERERRIKQKQEHLKKYESKNRKPERDSDDSREWKQHNLMNKEHKEQKKTEANAFVGVKMEATNERLKLAMP